MRDISIANFENHPGFISDVSYTYPGVVTITNRGDGGYSNQAYFNYIYLPSKTVKSLTFEINSGFIANSKVQIGIYNIKNGLPNERLASSEITITSNGEKEIIFNLPIKEGWYALAYYANATMTIRSVIDTNMSNAAYLYGIFLGALQTGLGFVAPYSPLPNVFIASSYTKTSCTRSPIIFVKFV